MSIWGILFWLWIASYVTSFILVKTVRKGMGLMNDAVDSGEAEPGAFRHSVFLIFGPLALLYPLGDIVMRKFEDYGARSRALKRKEQKANATSRSIKRYPELLEKLEKQWKSYETSGDVASQKFIKDVNTLGKDACSIPNESLENKDVLIEILRYARINIFTIFEGDALKQGERIAKSLGSSLKNISN